MKLKLLYLLFNFFVFSCFAKANEDVGILQNLNSGSLELQDDLNLKLEVPDLERILELADSFESGTIKVQRAKKAFFALLAIGVLSVSGCYLYYRIKYPKSEEVSSNGSSGETTETSGDENIDKKKEAAEIGEMNARANYFNRRGSVWYQARKNIGNGASLVLAGTLVTIVLKSFSGVTNFSKEQIITFLENGSLQNTFFALNDALIFNLNWVAELLENLSDSQLQSAGNFTSYSGLIDTNFTWIHALENFLAIALSKTKIMFGQNSSRYKKVLLDVKMLLRQTQNFVTILQQDINKWNSQGKCEISDATLKQLRILISEFLKFSQIAQLMLYKDSVKTIIPKKNYS